MQRCTWVTCRLRFILSLSMAPVVLSTCMDWVILRFLTTISNEHGQLHRYPAQRSHLRHRLAGRQSLLSWNACRGLHTMHDYPPDCQVEMLRDDKESAPTKSRARAGARAHLDGLIVAAKSTATAAGSSNDPIVCRKTVGSSSRQTDTDSDRQRQRG